MSLKDLQIETQEVRVGKSKITLRGLSFADMTRLLLEEQDAFKEAFDLVVSKTGEDFENLDAETLVPVVKLLAAKFPPLMAKFIACACDEPEQWEKVLKMTGPAQLEALMAVGRLTFTEPDSLKNFVANLIGAMSSVRQNIQIAPNKRS